MDRVRVRAYISDLDLILVTELGSKPAYLIDLVEVQDSDPNGS